MEIHNLDIEGTDITVRFKRHSIHILYYHEVVQLLKKATLYNCKKLSESILEKYRSLYQLDIAITKYSLTAEILGHYMAYHLPYSIARIIRIRYLMHLTSKIRSYAFPIDCGEKGNDSNRWFWNLSGGLLSVIYLFIRKSI